MMFKILVDDVYVGDEYFLNFGDKVSNFFDMVLIFIIVCCRFVIFLN